MDKLYTAWFSINGEDRYIYIPDSEVRYWEGLEGFDIRDESCTCLEKDELTPEHKIMIKMMDIIRRRSLQEIKKSEADEHGYRTLDVVKKKDRFIIRKATPYSVKMDVGVVAKMIRRDLEEFYNGIFDNVKYKVNNGIKIFDTEVFFNDIAQMNRYKRELLEERQEEGYVKEEAFLKYIDERGIELGSPLIEDIEKIHGNIGNGYYEVIYKATGII